MAKLADIEGIGATYARKLKAIGVRSTHGLLEQGATPQGRKRIASRAGVSSSLVLEWVNRADLFRVKGIGSEYSDLLEAAGVDTVPELAQRSAESLHKALEEANKRKRLVRRMPGRSRVQEWIRQAKKLPRQIKY